MIEYSTDFLDIGSDIRGTNLFVMPKNKTQLPEIIFALEQIPGIKDRIKVFVGKVGISTLWCKAQASDPLKRGRQELEDLFREELRKISILTGQ